MSTTTDIISSITSAVTGAAVPVIGVIDDAEKLGAEIVKEVEAQFSDHNTPAIINNVETQRIEADRVKIEKETIKDDVTLDQKETGK